MQDTAMFVRNAWYVAAWCHDVAEDGIRFTETAFHEDKAIIEAQQTVIALDPERPMLSMAFDAGPNLFRGIVRQLVAAEAARPERALAAAQAD